MARTLHIEDLVTRINDFQREVRMAVRHNKPLDSIQHDILGAQRRLQDFLENGHDIYLDYTPRE